MLVCLLLSVACKAAMRKALATRWYILLLAPAPQHMQAHYQQIQAVPVILTHLPISLVMAHILLKVQPTAPVFGGQPLTIPAIPAAI